MESEVPVNSELEELRKENAELKQKLADLEKDSGFARVIYSDATEEEKDIINKAIEKCLEQRQNALMKASKNDEEGDENKSDDDKNGEFAGFVIDTNGSTVNESAIESVSIITETPIANSHKKNGCFNCGGDHKLIDCPEPRNDSVIRDNMRKFREGSGEKRYYKDTSFSDVKVGVISEELQKALNILYIYININIYIYYIYSYIYILNLIQNISENVEPINIIENEEDEKKVKAKEKSSSTITFPCCMCHQHGLYKYPGFNAPIPEGANPDKWPIPLLSDECPKHGVIIKSKDSTHTSPVDNDEQPEDGEISQLNIQNEEQELNSIPDQEQTIDENQSNIHIDTNTDATTIDIDTNNTNTIDIDNTIDNTINNTMDVFTDSDKEIDVEEENTVNTTTNQIVPEETQSNVVITTQETSTTTEQEQNSVPDDAPVSSTMDINSESNQ
ncbi:hypothetical protein WA158_000567 [Blastocystis sp. Blastoise]